MSDSHDLILLGIGILIGLGFVAVLLLTQKQGSYVVAPSYDTQSYALAKTK